MLINPESIRGWPHSQDAVLQTGTIEQRSKHLFGFEKFPRNLARHARVMAIIGINFADRFGDFGELTKAEEATLLAVDFCEAGFLRDHGPSGGQITSAAITEPAGV